MLLILLATDKQVHVHVHLYTTVESHNVTGRYHWNELLGPVILGDLLVETFIPFNSSHACDSSLYRRYKSDTCHT